MKADSARASMAAETGKPSQPGRVWHAATLDEAKDWLSTDLSRGLPRDEARKRLSAYGLNRVQEDKEEPLWKEFLEEAQEPIILLLFATGIFYAIWGGVEDALVIFGVIVTLLSVEVLNEYRAGRAIRSLRKLAEPNALVIRDGEYLEIPAEDVVPGDVIVLQAGKRVPADALLTESYSLAADESSLTGESGPVEKTAGVSLSAETPLAERSNLVYAGDTILRGRATGLAFATGRGTQLGRTAQLAGEAEAPETLLQKTMRELSRWMILLALGFSFLVPLLGYLLVHEPLTQMILTGLSLAFSTIPEELPIIVTMVLALGAYRLSHKRVIVKDLQAVETLGGVTVIASDKTGTLTENRVQLKRVFPAGNKQRILRTGVLASEPTDGSYVSSDPIENAFAVAAKEALISPDPAELRRLFLFTFDNLRKMMSAGYEADDGLWVGVRGAPEAVLDHSVAQLGPAGESPITSADRDAMLAEASGMAEEGLRVMGVAQKTGPRASLTQNQAETGLVFLGLAAFEDPVRPEVKESISACRSAGIRPIMITGDHPLTAVAVAKQVALDESGRFLTGSDIDKLKVDDLDRDVEAASVFARITPEQKLRIVKALHDNREVVAVTGDGVNDAPALAASDIGIAMGRGSDVARESADMVLIDDNFATIVSSVAEGRTLFANLTKGVRYYLACKVALIGASLLPVLLAVPVPFAPIQIILMELFMDLAASATFVAEPSEQGLMERPPRNPKSKFLDGPMVRSILSSAVGLLLAVTIAYLLTWYTSGSLVTAQTVAFVTWLLGHVFLALNMRSENEPLSKLGPLSNRLMVVWALVTVAFTLIVTSTTQLETIFKTTPLGLGEWALVLPLVLVGTFWLEARKILFQATKTKHSRSVARANLH